MFLFYFGKRFLRRGALALLVCFAAAGMFLSCGDSDGSGSLNGRWKSTYEVSDDRIINTSAMTTEHGTSYKAKIAYNTGFTSSNGVLIIQFTEYKDWQGTSVPANVNKYSALYWAELTGKSVKFADAYNTTGPGYDGGYDFFHVMYNTLAEARTNFLPVADKAGNYVSGWGGITPHAK